MVKTLYISLFARCLLGNRDDFFALFQRISHAQNNANLFFSFLDMWLDKVDSISRIQDQKLTALALCSLLQTNDANVLKYLSQIISVCVGVLSASQDNERTNEDEYVDLGLSANSLQVSIKAKKQRSGRTASR